MFVAFEEFQKLDDTRMVNAAHDLDFLKNIGTLCDPRSPLLEVGVQMLVTVLTPPDLVSRFVL